MHSFAVAIPDTETRFNGRRHRMPLR